MTAPAKPLNNARVAAAIIIADMLENGSSLSRSVPEVCARVDARDQGLVKELVYGTTRWLPRLQALVDKLLIKPLRGKDRDIYALLLIGCYQLSYTRIPDHAAISETVSAVDFFRKQWARALVNGVLRQYQRRHETITSDLNAAQLFGHPQWLFDAIETHWPDQCANILAANNQAAPMTLRVNERQTTRIEYIELLERNGFSTRAGVAAAGAIYLIESCDVAALPGFNDGMVSVQDEAAQLCAPLVLQLKPRRVLDACCAPGGKSGHLLELDENIELDALEIDKARMQRVQENLHRLQLQARLITGDASQPAAWWDGVPYDAILLDAPCSASGVIRRHPDIKYLRRPADIAHLQSTQLTLLEQIWNCLRPGGLLVYATCSILPAENQDVIAAFCKSTPSCQHLVISSSWGMPLDFGRQLLPTINGNDGFYYACLRKIL